MGNTIDAYRLREEKSGRDIEFFFISEGMSDVNKAIQYKYLQDSYGRNMYNLGFGDYDMEHNVILDNTNTNNGDAYKVFNTVLSTIPMFFKIRPNSLLLIEGSDSKPEFAEQCRLSCKKNCINECRNFNRRINVYRKYVDKNYDQLNLDYRFWDILK